ncbi:hypothetical protein A7K91_21790 [Paenibacillus oryzae]|uniref:Uncharacterized protein n=1 Tax=Paenibacillus oryzae TaxID=1844972 RepID=A0A1A5YMX6_9BACL|nr:hypothetical protein [Paenibacillus oryzae]OBR66962.1 hypothetical protein A7K91_21790 [Paenibacillus oryzae]
MTANPAYILTPTDVKNIRGYVHTKYAAMPNDKRVEMVADAVQRIIHRQLPDFELSLKQRLTGELIRSTVLQEQRPVSADDVYRLCLELDHSDEKIAGPLQRWIDLQGEKLASGEVVPIAFSGSAASGANAEALPPAALSGAGELSRPKQRKTLLYSLLFVLLASCLGLYGAGYLTMPSTAETQDTAFIAPSGPEQELAAPAMLNELPADMKFVDVSREALLSYLTSRNSLLADEPYFTDIMVTAQEFDIHPALLFAITGQEQGFVPKDNKRAREIVNNPFNVFYSWQDFNTTTKESAQIAARTINRLSKDRPEGTEPLVWINRQYAEDPNWSTGVSSIFRSIVSHLEIHSVTEKAVS